MVEELDEDARPPLKIWLDTGTHEEGWERARVLRDGLIEKGWRLHDDLHYFEDEGAGHTEGAWAHRLDAALRFLYPPPPPVIVPPPRRRVRPTIIVGAGPGVGRRAFHRLRDVALRALRLSRETNGTLAAARALRVVPDRPEHPARSGCERMAR